MSPIQKHLFPESTRSLGRSAGCAPALLRRSTAYLDKDLGPNPPPFTAGDLISLAALRAQGAAGNATQHLAFYEGAYLALCAGLSLPPVNELTQAIGLDPRPRMASAERSPEDRPRRSGIARFLWARSRMIALQDPFWRVLMGDIWGVSAFEEGSDRQTAVSRGVAAYEATADAAAATLGQLDDALCALLGWDAAASVTLEDLQSKHGLPAIPEWEF
jgi:hypothetical protein